jgi:predicted nucleic acid-binding protein
VIFIDTGAFIARYRVSDDWHHSAIKGGKRLENSSRLCYTSNLVFAESLKLIAWFAGYPRAVRIGPQLLSSSEIVVLRTGMSEELQSLRLMGKFADQGLSFVDCTSMVLMRQLRISTVFGFDRHFELAGFSLWPSERR